MSENLAIKPKINTDNNSDLIPGQQQGTPHVEVDTDAFASHSLDVQVNPTLIGKMMNDVYGIKPSDAEKSSIVIVPPDSIPALLGPIRRESVRGQFITGTLGDKETTEAKYPDRNVSLIHPQASLPDRISHIRETASLAPPPARSSAQYNEILLHELSHNADSLRGELGGKKGKRIRKLAGSILGATAGLYLQSKVGLPSLEDAGMSELPLKAMEYGMRSTTKIYMGIGMTAVGRYLGYRTIPTERRAFKNMKNPEVLAKYGDMITVTEQEIKPQD